MRIPVKYVTTGEEYAAEEEPPVLSPEETPPVEVEAVPAPAEVRSDEEDGSYRDLYLRAMAEMANFRRRTEERVQEQIEQERHRLLREVLEFADNLERALAHLDEPGLRRGVRITWQELQRFLEREGVKPIEAEGRPFDPHVHEAVSTVADGGEPGWIVQEVQKGYRHNGRLLRPARVVVSR